MVKNFEKNDFCTRLGNLRKNLDQTQEQFAEKAGIPRTSLANYEKGISIPSADFIFAIKKVFNVNIDWLLTGEGEMFFFPSKEEKHPIIQNLEALVDQKLEKFESRIAELESQLKKARMSSPDSGMYLSEPEPEYGSEETFQVLSAENIAAGPPIPQSESLTEYVDVPRRLIKTVPEDYYAARIQGESMTAAGIPNGRMVLIRKSDVPRNGAIQVVRCGGRSTLKRVREYEDHHWALHYEDGTGRIIELGPDEDYQVQGDFIAVLPGDK